MTGILLSEALMPGRSSQPLELPGWQHFSLISDDWAGSTAHVEVTKDFKTWRMITESVGLSSILSCEIPDGVYCRVRVVGGSTSGIAVCVNQHPKE